MGGVTQSNMQGYFFSFRWCCAFSSFFFCSFIFSSLSIQPFFSIRALSALRYCKNGNAFMNVLIERL